MKISISYQSYTFELTLSCSSISISNLKSEFKSFLNDFSSQLSLNQSHNQSKSYKINNKSCEVTFSYANDDNKSIINDINQLVNNFLNIKFYDFSYNLLIDDYYFYDKDKNSLLNDDSYVHFIYLSFSSSSKKPTQKKNTFSTIENCLYKDKRIEEIITFITNGDKPLALYDEKTKQSKANSTLLSNINDPNSLLSALMSLRNNNNLDQRQNIINNILIPILSQGQDNSQDGDLQGIHINSLGSSGGSLNFQIGGSLRNLMRPVQPRQEFISQLVEMGFEENRARRALIATRNNIEAAVEMIANDEDLGLDDGNESQSQSQSQASSQQNIQVVNPDDDEYNYEVEIGTDNDEEVHE